MRNRILVIVLTLSCASAFAQTEVSTFPFFAMGHPSSGGANSVRGWQTVIRVANPGDAEAVLTIEGFDQRGQSLDLARQLGNGPYRVAAGGFHEFPLRGGELFAVQQETLKTGWLRITSNIPVIVSEVLDSILFQEGIGQGVFIFQRLELEPPPIAQQTGISVNSIFTFGLALLVTEGARPVRGKLTYLGIGSSPVSRTVELTPGVPLTGMLVGLLRDAGQVVASGTLIIDFSESGARVGVTAIRNEGFLIKAGTRILRQ